MTKVDDLREELRLGRNKTDGDSSQAIDGAGINTEGFSRSDDREEQPVPSDLHRSDTKDDTVDGPHHDTQRSLDEIIVGKRPTNRRSSQSDGSSPDSAETVRGPKRRRGKLEADDPIPFRPKERKTKSSGVGSPTPEIGPKNAKQINEESKFVQRGKTAGKDRNTTGEGEGEKQGIKLPKLPNFKEGNTLTIAEAKALEGPLLSALESDFYYIDQYIWYRTHDETQAPIWSDMDNEDITTLCSVLLRRGQKSPATAAMVRGIVNGSTYVDVAMLMGPRFVKTVQVLKNAPKVDRPSLLDRKRMARGV